MAIAYPQQTKDRAMELYLAERPMPEIVKELKIGRAALDTWVHRYKWNDIRRLASEQVTKTLATGNTMNFQQQSERVKLRVSAQVDRQLSALERSKCENMEDLMNTPAGEGFSSVLKKTVETAAQVYAWGDEKPTGLILALDARSFTIEQEAQLVVSDAPEASETTQPVDMVETTQTTSDIKASESGS